MMLKRFYRWLDHRRGLDRPAPQPTFLDPKAVATPESTFLDPKAVATPESIALGADDIAHDDAGKMGS